MMSSFSCIFLKPRLTFPDFALWGGATGWTCPQATFVKRVTFPSFFFVAVCLFDLSGGKDLVCALV